MSGRSVKWGRFAFLLVVALGVAVVAMPATALAKTTTRIWVSEKQVLADWSTGSNADTPSITIKLQKKTSSGWKSLTGTVKMYWKQPGTDTYQLVDSGRISAASAGLLYRGKYKFAYGGSSTYKSCTSYSARYDAIGETIGAPTITYDFDDATWLVVHVSQDIDWNTAAFTDANWNSLELESKAWFESGDGTLYSGFTWFYQEMWQPGTIKYSFRVRYGDIPSGSPSLKLRATLMSNDDYVIIMSEPRESSFPFNEPL